MLGAPASAALFADTAATIDVADRSEVRLRAESGDPYSPEVDAVTMPTARLHASLRPWDVDLRYEPMITVPDLQVSVSPELLNNGTLTLAWHQRRLRLTLVEDGSYGDQNFGYLQPTTPVPGQPAPALQLLPSTQTLLFLASHTYAGVEANLTRRIVLATNIAYDLSGGVDAVSRASLPFQRGPRVDARLDVSVTRRDHLSTTAGAQQTAFTATECPVPFGATVPATPLLGCRPEDDLFDAEEQWTHGISRTTDLAVTTGATVARVRLNPADAANTTPYPVEEAAITHHFADAHDRGELRFVLRLAPVIDQIAGIADDRVQATVAVSWQPLDGTSVEVDVGGAQSVQPDDPEAGTLLLGGAEVVQRLNATIDVALGTRGAWQKEDPFGVITSALTYGAVIVHLPQHKL